MPVPVRLTICAVLGALSINVISPEILPDTEGLKVTLMVQVEPTFSVAGQLLVWV